MSDLPGMVAAFLAADADQGPLLVAYSGGPDSTALLGLLVAAGARPWAVHVDHGLRPADELVREFEVVRATASRLGVGLTRARVARGAVEALARRTGEGLEAAARAYRYAALAEVARRRGASRVFLAHTRDDQVETLLMRALSGSGVRGLGGMRPRATALRRPLLGVAKADLLAWLAAENLPFTVDSTNPGLDYGRNRLRHLVVPALDEAWPGWREGLLATAAAARREAGVLDGLGADLAFVERPAGECPTPGPPALWAPRALLEAPEALAVASCLRAAAVLLGRSRLSSRLVRAALAVLRAGGGAYRGGGLLFEDRPEGVRMALALDFPHRDGYFVVIDDPGEARIELRLGPLSLRVSWEAPGAGQGIREGAFAFPLILRSPRPGDVLALRKGHKAVDALLAEWALPRELRPSVPLVLDRDGIVAVLARDLGGRDRYRPHEGGDHDRLLSLRIIKEL